MDNTNVSVQLEFVQKIVDDKKSVNVFLINGVKLQGVIEGHDNNQSGYDKEKQHSSEVPENQYCRCNTA
jgi:RNA chaperone Hfq